MTAILFLLFVAVMAGAVIWLVARYLNPRASTLAAVSLLAWLAYVGLAGHSGLFGNSTMRPPGALFLFAPVALFLVVFAARTLVSRVGVVIPLTVLVGLQTFRLIVELFIHQLWLNGIVPEMLTYSGANVDIWIGATAPLFAWLALRGQWGRRLAILWNVAGLLALANVVIRAILTAPGPLNLIHTDVPNHMFSAFPYMFIPGFFVPLAVALHLTALRMAVQTNRNSPLASS